MRGSFDAEMGARIQQRLRQQAEQLRQADRRRQTQSPSSGTTRDGGAMPEAAARTRDQRMADALDTLLAASAEPTGDAGPVPGEPAAMPLH